MSENDQTETAPKKRKGAAKPKIEKPEVDAVDPEDVEEAEDADETEVYVAPRSRARLARAERLARIGGDL